MPTLTSIKRGSGYRSSFSGLVATVFGASGAIGRGVCSRLGKSGAQIVVPYRGDHYNVRRIRVCGDLGQVLFSPFDLRDEESIRKAMTHSNVVFNLIGREFESRNFTFDDVHVAGARRLAKIARQSGVKRFIHISHVNAAENPRRLFLPKGSAWLRTKWLGEQAVLEEFPDATVIRSVDVYGRNDHFLEYYNNRARFGWGRDMPLWRKGDATIKQPLHMPDLVSGIMAAVNDPNSAGKVYEAYGPDRFLLSDLMDWMHDVMDKDYEDWHYTRSDLRLFFIPFIKGYALEKMPFGQKWLRAATIDKLERSQLTDEPVGLLTLKDLGVTPGTVQERMPYELEAFRAFKYHVYWHFAQRPPIHPLVPISRLEEKQLLDGESFTKNLLNSIGLHVK